MSAIAHCGWTFARLYPSRHPLASSNDALVGATALGIEVTEPVLAIHCGLGNIDPQHTAAGKTAQAAVDVALVWRDLPPAGATLVTIRPDADALCAMAVLALRAQGWQPATASLERIALVSMWDRFDQGDWREWSRRNPPLPRPATACQLGGAPMILRAVRSLAMDEALPLSRRVGMLADWIEHGRPPYRGVVKAAQIDEALLAQWNGGLISVETTVGGHIALIRADGPQGLALGYRHAPVVIAEAQLPMGRKQTVAQFSEGWVDMAGLRRDLADVEDGWGGSSTILGSPQGAKTTVQLKCLLALVAKRLLAPHAQITGL